jgi:hypothetical protein
MFIFKLLFLVSLIRVLIMTDQPFWCSGIYASAVFIFGLMTGAPFLNVLIAAAIAFALTSLYFWLLNRFEGFLWWIIMLVGFFIGML